MMLATEFLLIVNVASVYPCCEEKILKAKVLWHLGYLEKQ